MKDKFLVWLGLNRKPIGYTVGGLNVLSGISYAMQGQFGMCLLWLVVGGVIILDTWEFK